MKIAFIREMKNKRIRIGVECDEEILRYSVSERLSLSLGLCRGMELSSEVYSDIVREDEEYRAMAKALSLLSYGDNTKSALYMKLCRAGYSRDVARGCVEECLRLGYINERRQLGRLIIAEANRALRGEIHIIKKLSSKGYSRKDISEVIAELTESGEIDFSESFRALCEKRGAVSDEERRALMYKYGYRTSDID